MAAAAAQVQQLQQELQGLTNEAETVQQHYRTMAETRIKYQDKMAFINQTVQQRSKDTRLMEDIIILTLKADTEAQGKYTVVPDEPPQPEPQDTDRRVDAEEAVRVYQTQIDFLKEEIKYRTEMATVEQAMDETYRTGIDAILDVMEEYGSDYDDKLTAEILKLAERPDAPCSPRKKGRGGFASMLSPKRNKPTAIPPPVPDIEIDSPLLSVDDDEEDDDELEPEAETPNDKDESQVPETVSIEEHQSVEEPMEPAPEESQEESVEKSMESAPEDPVECAPPKEEEPKARKSKKEKKKKKKSKKKDDNDELESEAVMECAPVEDDDPVEDEPAVECAPESKPKKSKKEKKTKKKSKKSRAEDV